MADSFTHVSDDELDTGIIYAKTKYNVQLNRDLLRTAANQTGSRRVTSGEPFELVRYKVLTLHLTRRDKDSNDRYKAYSGAIGKIFSERRKFAAAARKKTTTPKTATKKAIKGRVCQDDGQFAWTF